MCNPSFPSAHKNHQIRSDLQHTSGSRHSSETRGKFYKLTPLGATKPHRSVQPRSRIRFRIPPPLGKNKAAERRNWFTVDNAKRFKVHALPIYWRWILTDVEGGIQIYILCTHHRSNGANSIRKITELNKTKTKTKPSNRLPLQHFPWDE